MRQETRIKYLYPNINDERKYKWLENATLEFRMLDSDITKLSLEEYQEKLGQSDTYDTWKKSSRKIGDLETTTVKWDNETVHALATYLSENPLYLPYFIEHHAIDIIGRFIGQPYLFAEAQKLPEKCGRGIWPNQRMDKDHYKLENFKAKYTLSLFLETVDELLDLGVNLEELTFVNIEENNTYEKLTRASLWNEKILKNLKEEDYIRKDGYRISPQEMRNILGYTKLSEFLDRVIDLVETEYYIESTEEATMMNPKKIVPFQGYDKIDMSYYKETGTIEIKAVCQDIQQKLKKVKKETEEIWKKRMEERIEVLKQQASTAHDESIQSELERLYEEINALKEDRPESLTKPQRLSTERVAEIHSEDIPKIQEEEYKEKIKELEESLARIEERDRSLKRQLKEYRKEEKELPEKTSSEADILPTKKTMKPYKIFLTGAMFGAIVTSLAIGSFHLCKERKQNLESKKSIETNVYETYDLDIETEKQQEDSPKISLKR